MSKDNIERSLSEFKRRLEAPAIPKAEEIRAWVNGAKLPHDKVREAAATIGPEVSEAVEKALKDKRKGNGGEPERETLKGVSLQLATNQLEPLVDAIEQAVIDARLDIYQRFGRIVRPSLIKGKTRKGENTFTPGIVEATTNNLLEIADSLIQFLKYRERGKVWVPVNAPANLINILMERGSRLRLPVITGIITTPIVFPDGCILEQSGYDAGSGLYFEPLGIAFPPIPSQPTDEQAAAALTTIKSLFEHYKFDRPTHRSVVLSFLLSTVSRAVIDYVPIHAISAPQISCGKSKIVETVGIIALGDKPAPIAIGSDSEEFEKRFDGELLSGAPLIYIDNIPEGVTLEGGFLDQFVTADKKKVRVLGESRNLEVPNSTSIAATGNNLKIGPETARRTLYCFIVTDVEDPFLKPFPFDPVMKARQERVEIVTAVNTFLLHFYQKANRKPLPFGSFEEWSGTIRAALIDVGEPDPVETTLDIRKDDPRRDNLAEVMDEWWAVFGGYELTVKEALDEAALNVEIAIRGAPIPRSLRSMLGLRLVMMQRSRD